MFGLFKRRRSQGRTIRRQPVTLMLESLEWRDCPAAPVISMLTAMPTNVGQAVELSGMVQDENPSGVTITFSGVVSGTTTVGADGSFNLTTTATELGSVHAVGLDDENLSSDTVSAQLTSQTPTVMLSASQTPGMNVTLSGTVSDEAPAGLVVNFSGVVTGSAVTDANGYYSLTTQATGPGTVHATTHDIWGQDSNVAQAEILPDPPGPPGQNQPPIVSLSITYGSQKTVTISGMVTDETPGGLAVSLTGVVNASVTTNPDGTFSWTGDASALGIIQATATDPFGLTSNVTQINVVSNPPAIANFGVTVGPDNIYTFEGQVTDESAENLVVQFGGLASLMGLTATVDATGWFSLTVRLQPGESGTVTAQTTDWWGLDSNVGTVIV